jgi:hypothetical protein
MKKIISLFQRNYDTDRMVRNEVVPGAEWVLAGEGIATRKWDGTCCLVRGGVLHKRYDRKLTKDAQKRGTPYSAGDFKPAPPDWEAAEPEPNLHTGHWPGWIAVGTEPESKWHLACWTWATQTGVLPDGTYELCGPHVQGNPEDLAQEILVPHGKDVVDAPRTFGELCVWLAANPIEGVVWHHPDGRMVKIKRKDFGLEWPMPQEPKGS